MSWQDPADKPDVTKIRYSTHTVRRQVGTKCTLCGMLMPKGTKYERFVGKFDGVFVVDRCCLNSRTGLPCLPVKCAECHGTGSIALENGRNEHCQKCFSEGVQEGKYFEWKKAK